MAEYVPVNEPLLDGNEARYLKECINTGWISSEGPFVRNFEGLFAERMGRRYGVAVSNGTAALELAVGALGIGPGDEVIIPTFTIISCVAAVVRAGATPVITDCDPLTWNMDSSNIEALITPRTKAIMVVHIYGLPVDMDPLVTIAQRHGLILIEDAAEMHGQEYRGRPCGSFGEVSAFSFYPNKHVTTGEGGMLLMDDPALADRCRSLRNLCFGSEDRFVHQELGWNFRMSNLQAAVGVAQLERLDEFVSRKREIGQLYQQLLSDVPGLQLPQDKTPYAENIYWVFGVVLDETIAFDAKQAMSRLHAAGVGTRAFFWPMHEQPVFRRLGYFEGASHPVAEKVARRGFYLPSGLGLEDEQITKVADSVRSLLS